MISRLATYLASAVVKKTEEDQYQEVFKYVFFIILNYILFFGYSLILGSLLGIPFQSILFFATMVVLRRYAGGYHANTETRCLIISTVYFSSGIVFIKLIFSEIIKINAYYIIAAIMCALTILFLCPCDSPEKPLEQKRIRIMKIKCIALIGFLVALILFICASENHCWASMFIISIFIETVLIVSGTIKLKKSNLKR